MRSTLTIESARPLLADEDEQRFAELLAHGKRVDAAYVAAFPETILNIDVALALAVRRDIAEYVAHLRQHLTEASCVTRAEKRIILSGFIRESRDAELVLKAISLDNKMTGDEVSEGVKKAEVYVLRVGDVVREALDADVIG